LPDIYAKRSADAYGQQFALLFPTGPAWPTAEESVFQRTIRGIAAIFGLVAQRADDLLVVESDPRSTIELLEDWERAFGLPDPCAAEPLTIADRQRTLVNRITAEGGQSVAFFKAVAAALGYTIAVHEFSPFMCGVSRVGDTRSVDEPDDGHRWEVGPQSMRFYWTVKLSATRLSWFRVASGQVGVDPHLRIALATDLECVIRRWKPAHTEVLFDYSGLGLSDPMAGTP
jgi:uncharacterized protein YmfQ (DUF2313 family)